MLLHKLISKNKRNKKGNGFKYIQMQDYTDHFSTLQTIAMHVLCDIFQV